MDFRLLQMRLLVQLRARLRNGEITERSLSRITGISQPHIHNVLKGIRLLSMEKADQILHRLQIDVLDLLTAGEAGGAARQKFGPGECRAIPLLDGWIGPGHAFPGAAGRETYPFPAADVLRLKSPVAARVAPDPLGAPFFSGGGVVLLECADGSRKEPEEGYFALDLSGQSAIGLVRRVGPRICAWTNHGGVWQSSALPDSSVLDFIRGQVRLWVRRL